MNHENHHPAIAAALQHFTYSHLPPDQATIAKPFHDLAHQLAASDVAFGPDIARSLLRLAESKDWAIHAIQKGFESATDKPTGEA